MNVGYTILGSHFAIPFIQISNIYQLGKLLKKIEIWVRRRSTWMYFDFTKLRSKWNAS